MRNFLDNLLLLCRRWDSDKWAHIVGAMIVCWLIATIAMVVTTVFCPRFLARAIMGLVGVCGGAIVCLWKEWYDKRTTDLYDTQDLAAGFVGVALFYVIYCV